MSQELLVPLKIIHRTPMGVISESTGAPKNIWAAAELLDVRVNAFPTVAIIDETPVMRQYWHDPFILTVAKEISFVSMPQGDFAKNILSLVATIALAIVAPYAAGIIGGFLGITSTLGLQLLSAGIVLAGSFLIGTFLAPSAPKPQDNSSKGSVASPTYSLSGSGNSARLFQPIPRLYGKHILYPDYAGAPYSEFTDNQQFLNQLLCLGLGEYSLHEIRVEDTPVWNDVDGYLDNFVGIQIQVIEPGQTVTLFHSQVITSDEVGSQDLPNWAVNGKIQMGGYRVTSYDAPADETKEFRFAIAGQKVRIGGGVNAGVYTVIGVSTDYTWIDVNQYLAFETINTFVELETGTNYLGPYVANPSGTITNKIQADFVLPGGLYYTADNGALQNNQVSVRVEARAVNNAGIPTSGYFLLGEHTHIRQTNTPQRITETYYVPENRYEVRARRVEFQNPSSRYQSAIQWNALKAFIPNDNIYPDVTLLAIRLLATGQLTQTSSQRINTVQTAKIPVPSAGYALTPTRSIAWAALDILRNPIYGAKIADSQIDLATLTSLDALWASRGDTFNGVFDTTYSIWEALSAVLKVGRTSPVLIAGKVTFVRDEARALPRCVFTPASIVRGSFETQHILFDDEAPDDIIVQYVDERTWRQHEVQCTQLGAISAKPERLTIFGITNYNQAWREGMFMGAVNARRRIVATFTAEMEGRMLMRGDSIVAAHDLYEQWGAWGEIQGYDTSTRYLYLSEPMHWDGDNTQHLLLRKRDGKAWGPVAVYPTDDDYVVELDASELSSVESAQGSIVNTFNLETDGVLTNYIICKVVSDFKKFIVVSGKPKDEQVSLTCIIDDPNVYLADQGTPPPDNGQVVVDPGTDPTRPDIAYLSVTESEFSGPSQPTLIFAWGQSSYASSYRLQISYNNASWETLYEGPSTTYTTALQGGLLYVRVQGINSQAGPYKYFTGTFGAGTQLPLPVPSITQDYNYGSGTLFISWTEAVRATSYTVKVYSESVSGSGDFDTTVLARGLIGNNTLFNSSDISSAGGPWPNIRIGITAVNGAGTSSETFITVNGISLQPVTNFRLLAPYNKDTFQVTWFSGGNAWRVRVIVEGVVKLTYDTSIDSVTISYSDMAAVGGPWRELTVTCASVAGSLESAPSSIPLIYYPIALPYNQSISYSAGYSPPGIKVEWQHTSDTGVDQARLYHSQVGNFSGAEFINVQYKNPNEIVTWIRAADAGSGDHFFWITAYDSSSGIESAPVVVYIGI